MLRRISAFKFSSNWLRDNLTRNLTESQLDSQPMMARANNIQSFRCKARSAEHSMRITVGYGDPARGQARKLLRWTWSSPDSARVLTRRPGSLHGEARPCARAAAGLSLSAASEPWPWPPVTRPSRPVTVIGPRGRGTVPGGREHASAKMIRVMMPVTVTVLSCETARVMTRKWLRPEWWWWLRRAPPQASLASGRFRSVCSIT